METLNKIFTAAKTGNILELTQLVTPDNVNAINDLGFTAFLLAAKYANKQTLQWLVDNGADAKKVKEKNENALFFVTLAHAGQLSDRHEKLTYLLTLGLSFDHPSFEFVYSNHWEQLKNQWMKDWTYVDQNDRWGCNLLHYAAAWGNLPAVKWLINIAKLHRHHADTLRGATALHRASFCDQLEVVQWLVQEAKIDIEQRDTKGWRAVTGAANHGHLRVVQWLIQHSVSHIDLTDDSGWTSLHHAANNGHLAIVQWLIDVKKASIEIKDFYGWTVLHHAANRGHLAIVQWLAEVKGVSLDVRDNYGWSALYHAVNNAHHELTTWLLSKLVNVTVKDSQGNNALFLSLEQKQLVLAELLINHMVASGLINELLNETNSSRQICLYSAKLGYLHILQRLYQVGANLEVKDHMHNTALLLAVRGGHWHVVEWLLIQGSSLDVCNNNTDYCLDLAAKFSKTDPTHFLFVLEQTIQKTKLTVLRLRNVTINSYQVELIVKGLVNHPTIIRLHLEGIEGLKQDHCEQLAALINQHKSLASIKLNNCQLNLELLQPILATVMYSRHLKELYLDDNPLTNDCYHLLKTMLTKNKTLTVLSINQCHNLTDDNLTLLAEGIAANTVLKELYLCQSSPVIYTKIGLETFINTIINHQCLAKIVLNFSNLEFDDLEEILKAFLARNAKKTEVKSMAQWVNMMRNVTASNDILYPKLPSKTTSIPTLQGYCTFFIKQLGVTIKQDKDSIPKAYFNDKALALSSIVVELINSGECEFIECRNVIHENYIPVMFRI